MSNKFQPRLTRPGKDNKYYKTVGSGGYSTAIKGSPTDSQCDVLANCFSGDTKIITREGPVRLDSIVNKEVEVLTVDGQYRTAIGGYYGEQEMYKITFGSGESFICTANHRWLVRRISFSNGKKYEKQYFKTTLGLNQGDYIPYCKNLDTDMDEDAIRHGFIYGDGSYYIGKRSTRAHLCGYKQEYMMPFFENALHISMSNDAAWVCYPYPAEYKCIPDISEPLPYLRGFICGLIASDGCVDKYGCITISTVKEFDAKKISKILSVLSYKHTILKEIRDTNYKNDSTLYRLSIKKSFIPSELLLNPKQKDRFLNAAETKNISYAHVKAIERLGYTEDCFCISEPETTTMVLDGCIVTGQCVGYAFGRFNEIAVQMLGKDGVKNLFTENGGKLKDLKSNTNMPLLQPLNAENFYDTALSQGLEISQTPQIGACMCWQKGATRSYKDGAGHVAIVEEVISPTSVRTSESGYGCSNPFWTQIRYKGNGNWGAGSDYKFLGFIKNPAIDANADPYPVPTRILQEGLVGEDVKWLQWKLRELGYTKDAIDGWFGLLTYCAVAGFQLKNGLEVDAIVGPATVNALQKADKAGQSVWKV